MMKPHIIILKNFIATYLIKRHYFLVVLIVPYLTSTIGIELFGTLEFGKSLCYYFTIFISFGFNYISTQQIMQSSDNINDISKIFSATYIIKFCITLLSIPILIFCLYCVPALRDMKTILVAFWGVAVASSFTPVFLYQGMNKMGCMVLIDSISRVIFILCLYTFIKTPDDAWLYPTLYALTDLLRTIVSIFWGMISFGVRFVFPGVEDLRKIYNPSASMFLTTLSRTIYERFPQILLGTTLGRESVGLYVLSTRVIGEINMATHFAMQAIYPTIANIIVKNFSDAVKILRNIGLIFGIIVLFLSISCHIYAEKVVYFLSNKPLPEAVALLRIASLIPGFVYIYTFIGNSILATLGKRKLFSYIVTFFSIAATVTYGLILGRLGMETIVYSILIAEILTAVTVVAFAIPVVKKKCLEKIPVESTSSLHNEF